MPKPLLPVAPGADGGDGPQMSAATTLPALPTPLDAAGAAETPRGGPLTRPVPATPRPSGGLAAAPGSGVPVARAVPVTTGDGPKSGGPGSAPRAVRATLVDENGVEVKAKDGPKSGAVKKDGPKSDKAAVKDAPGEPSTKRRKKSPAGDFDNFTADRPKAGRKKKSDRKIMLFAAGAGGLSLLLVVGLIIYLMSGTPAPKATPSSPAVAGVTPAATGAPPAPAQNPVPPAATKPDPAKPEPMKPEPTKPAPNTTATPKPPDPVKPPPAAQRLANVAYLGFDRARASSELAAAGEVAKNAFDGSDRTKWYADNRPQAWLQCEFADGKSYMVLKYTLTAAGDSPGRDPKDWEFQGSDDGRWDRLDAQSGVTFANRQETKTFAVNDKDAKPYKFYRLNVTATAKNEGVQLQDLGLMALWADNLKLPEKPTPLTPPPPPPPPPAESVTPDYYPLATASRQFDIASAHKPLDPATKWNVVRRVWAVKPGGVIESYVTQAALNAAKPDPAVLDIPKAVHILTAPEQAKTAFVRRVEMAGNQVKFGPPPEEGKPPQQDVILQLGAKKGESWKATLPGGVVKTYTVIDFGKYKDKPSVTVRGSNPVPIGTAAGEYVETIVYAKGVGVVKKDEAIEAKGPDGKTQSFPVEHWTLRD